MADYSELKRKAQEIRDEVKAGANTANRVGLALEETVNALEAENQRAEQAELDLQDAVQLLQDNTEDLQSIRDEVERLGSEKADKTELEKTNQEVSKKQDKLEFYKEDPSNGSVEIFAQDVVSIQNDSQGGVSCVKTYNEEDTEEGLIPVARMSAEKDNGDSASVTVRGNEVHINGDAVKVNRVELGAKLDTINKELEASANSIQLLQDETEDLPSIKEKLDTLVVNDLTTGGADKALSAEMGKEIDENLNKTQVSVGCLSVFKSGYIGIENGSIAASGSRVHCPYYFRVKPSSIYEIAGYETGLLVLISRYDKNKNYIGYTGYFTEQSSFEVPSDTYYIRISLSEPIYGLRIEDASCTTDILNLEANYDIANIELELYKDSAYVNIFGREQSSTTTYGISLYNVKKGDIIIFKCVATNSVAIISEYTNSSYTPIVIGDDPTGTTTLAPSVSRYCVTKDMTLALSGRIGSTSVNEYSLKIYTPKNAATDNAERASINSKLSALEANQYRLLKITNYSESAEINQIVDGVVSSSATSTRRIYYVQLKEGDFVALKGDNTSATKFVEWGFYSDVPNINSVAIDYGKVNASGENIVYYTAPQDGYLAVAVNLSYHKGWLFYNAFSFSNYPQNEPTPKTYNPSNIKYIPHRGVRSSEIPENTTYSVMHAAFYGIKYSECDVRYTSDGVGVVMHDTTINRTMYKNDLSEIDTATAVSDNTYEYLSQFVYKSTNPAYRTRLQTMREYIDACAYWNICPIIQMELSSEDLKYCMNRLGDNWICYGGNWEKVRAYSSNVLYLTSSNYDTVDLMLEKFKEIGGNVGISKLFNTELTDEIISACRENHYEIMASYAYDKPNIPDAIRRGATIVLSDNVGREIRKVRVSSDSGWGDFNHNGSITENHVSITSGQYVNYAIDKKGIYKVFIEFEGDGQCTLPSYNDSGAFGELSFIMTGGVFQYNFLYLENSSYTISIDANSDMKIKRVIIFYEES